jgi:hypothetical protein
MQSRSAGRPLHELSNMKYGVCNLFLQQAKEIFVQLQSEGITRNIAGENCVDKMRKLLYRTNWWAMK